MGREIRRVPLDFSFPINETWTGFLHPDKFHEDPCPADCQSGNSWQYSYLYDLWYGKRPFSPAMTGSTPLTPDTPAVRAFAERNIGQAPEYYGSGERAIWREGRRLADLWNQKWNHHLSQVDVDALVDGGRLWEFTREVIPGKGWQPKENSVRPTAAQVNDWSCRTMGHDGINAHVVIRARCERYGLPMECSACDGHGSLEAYPGQREERDAWEPTDPPEGEGWQLWQTVSEGGPISPVFATPEELARWMASPEYRWGASKHSRITYENALAFIEVGWAPSATTSRAHGVETGEQFIGRTAQEDPK